MMRTNRIRLKTPLLVGLTLVLLLSLALLIPPTYAKYRTQITLENKIEYTNKLVSSFTMTNGTETRGPSDTFTCYLVPGSTVHVSPKIQIAEKTEIPAELYVEVCATRGLRFSVENEDWAYLEGLTGLHDGLIYVYRGDLSQAGEISVEASITASRTPSSGEKFVFYAYMIQKTEGSSAYETFAGAISQPEA